MATINSGDGSVSPPRIGQFSHQCVFRIKDDNTHRLQIQHALL